MPKHESSVSRRHMLDHAREAYILVHNKLRADLDADRLLNLALVRLLEIIGEAASRIAPEDRAHYAGIPWPQIISMRNRLIHGYDLVDFEILWQTLVEDLSPLIVALESILSSN
jgi:uncharacterized protein with HEPN domain